VSYLCDSNSLGCAVGLIVRSRGGGGSLQCGGRFMARRFVEWGNGVVCLIHWGGGGVCVCSGWVKLLVVSSCHAQRNYTCT